MDQNPDSRLEQTTGAPGKEGAAQAQDLRTPDESKTQGERAKSGHRYFPPSLAYPLLGAGLFLGGLLLWSYFQFGSLHMALAYWRGERVIIQPSALSVGTARVGEERAFTVRIANFASRDVTLVGSSASCGCISLDRLPLTIAHGDVRELTIKVRVTGKPGAFNQGIQYYTDNQSASILQVPITGTVSE